MAHIVVTDINDQTHTLSNHEFDCIIDGEIMFTDLTTVNANGSASGMSFQLEDVKDVFTQR